ncbi:(deoxy)nucleoside triphosphate pyrophosphohydrolase [Patescibacteria group bacterium]|nr:(deoxy)nucleoside triphosphate pyrophosphohydrolase [Patescibacteria group bacterium]
MRILDVGAAVLLWENKILITQRDRRRILGGKWEFPGGKIEKNESVEEGLTREILEELGVDIEVGELIAIVPHHYRNVAKIKLHTYFCVPKKLKFKLSEHENIAWVEPKELLGFDLAPVDIKVAKLLLERL